MQFTNDNCTINCLLSFTNDLDCRCSYFFAQIITTSSFVNISSCFIESRFYVVILILFLIQLYMKLWIMTYRLRYAHIITYIHTFIMVTFDTGTNFPAVSWNSLLAAAMMSIRHRWKDLGVPTQSHPNAASLTLSAWNILQFYI